MSDVTFEIDDAARHLLLKAWQGEVYGVEVYSALADSRVVATEAVKLRTLVALELTMKHRLTGTLRTLSIPEDLADIVEVGERDVEQQRDASWSQLLRWISADAAIALEDYLPLEVMSITWAPEERAVALDVIAHERAIISFCTKDLAGEIDSLRDVEALSAPTPAE